MPIRFLISTLQAGVDPSEYEQWVRDCDYKLTSSLPNYRNYRVHRVASPIDGYGAAGWQYIEQIDVASLAQHDADLASPAGVELRKQLYGRYLDRSKNIYFTTEAI